VQDALREEGGPGAGRGVEPGASEVQAEDRGGGAVDGQGARRPGGADQGGPAGEAGRDDGEVQGDGGGDWRDPGEAAQGGDSGDALWAGVGAVLESGGAGGVIIGRAATYFY